MSRARAKRERPDAAPESGPRPSGKGRKLEPAIDEELERLDNGLLKARRALAHIFFSIPLGGRTGISYEYEDASEALCEADDALQMLRCELESRARVAS